MRHLIVIALLAAGIAAAQDTTKFYVAALEPKAKLVAMTVPVIFETADSSSFAFADSQELALLSVYPVGVVEPAKFVTPPPIIYQNPLDLGNVTLHTVTPFAVVFLKLPTSGTEIVSVKRYRYGVDDVAVDMTSVCTIAGRILTVPNVWLSTGDTPGKGKFRIQVIARSSDGAVQDEANVIGLLAY